MTRKKGVEIVRDEKKDSAWYERELQKCIADYYYTAYGDEGVEAISKRPQSSWIACMEYCRRCCVNREDLVEIIPHKIHPTCGGVSCMEAYSPERVETLAKVFINLCCIYDRVPSVFGFSVLSGIDRENMQRWVADGVTSASTRNTPKRAVQLVRDARGEILQCVAISGGKGTIGAVACLNNSTWKETQREAPQIGSSSLDDIPRLPVFHSDGFIENADLLGVPSTSNLENIPKLGNMNLEKW